MVADAPVRFRPLPLQESQQCLISDGVFKMRMVDRIVALLGERRTIGCQAS
jgi:hypothetical protein